METIVEGHAKGIHIFKGKYINSFRSSYNEIMGSIFEDFLDGNRFIDSFKGLKIVNGLKFGFDPLAGFLLFF